MKSTMMLMAMNVAPSGLPTCLRCRVPVSSSPVMLVLRRNNCVMAMPMLAKESDVRNHARNVRSMFGEREYGYIKCEELT